MRKILLLFCAVLMLLSGTNKAHANEYHGLELQGECALPEDFSFQVSDVCRGHDYFWQASAREDGWYALMSLYTNAQENWDAVYSLHYVDIYDADGKFIMELSFWTWLDCAVELVEDRLDIYFQTMIVSYLFESDSLVCYKIPPRSTVENNLLFDLRKATFTSGPWTYSCKGFMGRYTKLERSDGVETQNLWNGMRFGMEKFSSYPWSVCISGTVVSIPVVLALFYYKKRKNNNWT